MDVKQELINRLRVPENWDKYDYQTQRYSFNDMQEVLEDIVRKLTIPVVVGQNERFTITLEQAIAKAKPNLDKITDVDKHLDDIR